LSYDGKKMQFVFVVLRLLKVVNYRIIIDVINLLLLAVEDVKKLAF
jgi:hypothetical protein